MRDAVRGSGAGEAPRVAPPVWPTGLVPRAFVTCFRAVAPFLRDEFDTAARLQRWWAETQTLKRVGAKASKPSPRSTAYYSLLPPAASCDTRGAMRRAAQSLKRSLCTFTWVKIRDKPKMVRRGPCHISPFAPFRGGNASSRPPTLLTQPNHLLSSLPLQGPSRWRARARSCRTRRFWTRRATRSTRMRDSAASGGGTV